MLSVKGHVSHVTWSEDTGAQINVILIAFGPSQAAKCENGTIVGGARVVMDICIWRTAMVLYEVKCNIMLKDRMLCRGFAHLLTSHFPLVLWHCWLGDIRSVKTLHQNPSAVVLGIVVLYDNYTCLWVQLSYQDSPGSRHWNVCVHVHACVFCTVTGAAEVGAVCCLLFIVVFVVCVTRLQVRCSSWKRNASVWWEMLSANITVISPSLALNLSRYVIIILVGSSLA